MATAEYNCPSCGAPLSVENRFSKVVVCQYCGQTCAVTADGLNPSGKQAKLADFESIFAVGKSGRIAGEAFHTLGRLRYSYDDGFWDEWFLSFENGKRLWLQEDEGEFTAFEKETLTSPVPPFDDISVGSMISVNQASVFVTERNRAKIEGGEGELYFTFTPGMPVKCVDGNASGKLVSIEYTEDEIHFSQGREISLNEIEFDPQ